MISGDANIITHKYLSKDGTDRKRRINDSKTRVSSNKKNFIMSTHELAKMSFKKKAVGIGFNLGALD